MVPWSKQGMLGGWLLHLQSANGGQVKGHPWPNEVPSSLTGGLFA